VHALSWRMAQRAFKGICCGACVCALILLVIAPPGTRAAGTGPAQPAASGSHATLTQLIGTIRGKARALENSTGMRLSFRSFTTGNRIPPESLSYPDYVVVRLLYEATRDAGSWNLHWTITDRQPNSDNIWRQWQGVKTPSSLRPTASAECDELSALYAFLAGRAGIKGVGLLWPYPNHTVAVWVLRPAQRPVVRVVVPTSQIFLDVTDSLDTKTFNPWGQKSIYEYTRRDVPDAFELSRPLSDFFLSQLDKYAGASDSTLQQLRYLRESVFLKHSTPEAAARDALKKRNELHSGSDEDLAAFQNFAQDMRAGAQ
jgi:hypothetical protein